MSKHFGKCALCGKECELTFEHIPPRAAFNSTRAKAISGDKIMGNDDRMPWNIAGLPYQNQQRGMGRYTLCRECNNNTGTWYGDEYNQFAHTAWSLLHNDVVLKAQGVEIKRVYPLRLIKQILSMFCSINNFDFGDEKFEQLRKFVLDKEATNLDKDRFRLCMYFTKSDLMKYAPLSVIMVRTQKEYESIAVSEITANPMGFILYFDPISTWEYKGIDITAFADCGYDDECTITLPLCIYEVNDMFPTDYRTKEEIQACVEENRKRRAAYVKNN